MSSFIRLFSQTSMLATCSRHIRPFHASSPVGTMYEKRARDKAKRFAGKKKFQMKTIPLKNEMTVRELANAMEKPVTHIFNCLDQMGHRVRNRRDSYLLNQSSVIINVIQLSGMRYSIVKSEPINYDKLIEDLDAKDDTILKRSVTIDTSKLVKRSPCVTIMGHVDHGKTTLLDALRGSHVVDGEFGGITQHIGAFNCKLTSEGVERNITFLDTPGHAAYSMMRSRGAKCTDIIVLVIAAEDSIMAQTVESIKHAKLSGCKIIVAINKIDKASEKQLAKCKNDLLQYGLIPEEMGGDVQVVPISALKKINLELLKEEILTCAEIMELKGDAKGLVEGYVLESKPDQHRGKIATVLVKRGTLRKGDFLTAGNSWCKVKYLFDENSVAVSSAGVSEAVQVMGWKELPNAGDEVLEMVNENSAKDLVELRNKKDGLVKLKNDLVAIEKKREEHDQLYKVKAKERRESGLKFIAERMYDKNGEILSGDASLKDGGEATQQLKTMHIILKTDVNGSLEAIMSVLETYNQSDKVILDLVHFEVGPVKKTDLELAEAFNAPIYCFNLPTEQIEKSKDIKIKHFNVIYQMFDDLKAELAELAPLEEEEEIRGEAEVKACFKYDETNSKTIVVAGSRCVEGMIDKKLFFKLIRDGKEVADRLKCHSLKHVKTEVNTVKRNVEFGVSFEGWNEEFMSGDKLVCYEVRMVKSLLDWNLGF